MGKTLIRAENFSFQYKDSEEGIFDLSFSIDEGDFVLLAGDSGSGKSTLIKCLNGLIPQLYEGRLEGELSVVGLKTVESAMSERNRVMGSVFQNPRSQFFTTNSTAELVFAMENYGYKKSAMEERLKELTEDYHLDELLDRDILSLSSGERQLLALACSQSLRPDILLFDEPSANLDYGNTMLLSKLLRKLKEGGYTIIIADHRFHYLRGLVDKVFLFKKGAMEFYESETDFKTSSYDTRSFELFELDSPLPSALPYSPPVMEVRNLAYKDILKQVSFSLAKGEVSVLMGNNGAGKTTIAKILTGSLKPSKGEVRGAILPLYIMQDADFQLFGSSVFQELKIAPHEVEGEAVLYALDRMDLSIYQDKHPFDLSGGQKQRLQIAMALVSDRDIIIFDEPTSGLDVRSMNRVAREMEELKKDASVLVISHDYEFIRRVANRIIYLKDGEIKKNFILDQSSIGDLNAIFKEMEENVR